MRLVYLKETAILRTVIFDLDGTLIDSEPNYQQADKAFLAAQGIELPQAVWSSVTGMGSRSFIEMVQRDYGLQGELDQLLDEKDRTYRALAATQTRSFPEMRRFLLAAREAGLSAAIASGSSLAIIELSLGWAELPSVLFTAIVSAEEVGSGKPAPDIFLETARRLGCSPADCLVVEDSRPGVLAALAAGMHCVAVPAVSGMQADPVFSQADILYDQGMAGFSAAHLVGRLEASGLWPR